MCWEPDSHPVLMWERPPVTAGLRGRAAEVDLQRAVDVQQEYIARHLGLTNGYKGIIILPALVKVVQLDVQHDYPCSGIPPDMIVLRWRGDVQEVV